MTRLQKTNRLRKSPRGTKKDGKPLQSAGRVGGLFPKRCVDKAPGQDGVVMIKIDGLGLDQFKQALSAGRLPHLQRLANDRGGRPRPFYAGIPSATPAVQGELFFGVKSSVPAVAFIDRAQGKKSVMIFPGAAAEKARVLASRGRPLLKGGTSYSNIYTGGADEARYCTETMKLRSIRHMASSVKLFLMLLAQPGKLLRMAGYPLLEAAIALYDFFRGLGRGKSVAKELKFIPTRLFVCILLRELIRTRVKMDIARGVPIVHASFLGYDEQAHRRGPDSAFAHWTLKGIDDAVGDIHRSMKRSPCRNYRMVVYSDHGQEAVDSYEKRYGKSLRRATVEIAAEAEGGEASDGEGRRKRYGAGNPFSGNRARGLFFSGVKPADDSASIGQTQVAAMGPLAHVYFPEPPDAGKKRLLSDKLVRQAHVPLVLFVENGAVRAVTRHGRFDLAGDGARVLGADHPFVEQTAMDLAETCRHPDAGDLVLSGWTPEGQPLSFAVENGAHGGPGKSETCGFVLLPADAAERNRALRPLDLRRRVFDLLDRKTRPSAENGGRTGREA